MRSLTLTLLMAATGLLIVRFKVILERLTKLITAAALSAGLMATAASAATIFNFTGSRSNLGTSQSYSVDGIGLDVTSTGGNIHRNGSGLGVTGNPDGNRLGSNNSTSESLTFSFSRSLTLLGGIVFEHRGGVEMFEILDGDSNVIAMRRVSGPGGSSTVTVDDLDLEGGTFTFRHVSGSGIRINEFSVLVPVPLPAAGTVT